jgi:hypothetical protein
MYTIIVYLHLCLRPSSLESEDDKLYVEKEMRSASRRKKIDQKGLWPEL